MNLQDIKIGTPVIYWGIIKDNGEKLDPFHTKISSEPWQLGSGTVVCKVEGKSGCVLIKHLDPETKHEPEPTKELEEYDYMERVQDVFTAIDGEESKEGILKAKHIIKEIADHTRKTGLYRDSLPKADHYLEQAKALTPDKLDRVHNTWFDFMVKSIKAPTSLHLRGLVVLMIPVLDTLINELEEA